MLDGTVTADGFELVRLIVAPPVVAGPVIVTVPVDGVPPWTDAGLRLTLWIPVVTVSVACLVVPRYVPEMRRGLIRRHGQSRHGEGGVSWRSPRP